MINDNLALTESISLRNQNLKEFSDEQAINTLNKAKALIMVVWEGKNIATTEKIAEFYEVPKDTVQTAIKNNRSEFESDGLRTIKEKELTNLKVMSIIDITPETSSLTVWTPRAALRLGMVLRDSSVAKNIRNLVLNLVETIPQIKLENESLKLQLELEKEKNKGKELDNMMITLHGLDATLAIRGNNNVIIEKETIVTELVESNTGKKTKILTAEQTKKEVKKRTGQNLASLKFLTETLQKEGRDDLLVKVNRSQPCQYPIPEKLDEIIDVVYGKSRQRLLGE